MVSDTISSLKASLNQRPGPVIRINPYEVHIMDSDFLNELYVGANKGKVDKWDWAVHLTSSVRSIFCR